MTRVRRAIAFASLVSVMTAATASCSDDDHKPAAATTSSGSPSPGDDSGTRIPTDAAIDASDAATDAGTETLPSCNGVTGNTLYLNGDTDDPIHPGEETIATSFNPILRVESDGTVTVINLGSDAGWTTAFSSRNLKKPLGAGNYPNAGRYPFEPDNTPGLDVHKGIECNSADSAFTIAKVELDDAGLKSFAASFLQHCEKAKAKLTGCVSYER